MPLLLTAQDYINNRQNYSYQDCNVEFTIIQTGGLKHFGKFKGIFPANIPIDYPLGLNLRKFEYICQEVFHQALAAQNNNNLTKDHINNIQTISSTIVHWKMASQGGRATRNAQNVLNKWNPNTHINLLNAYTTRSLRQFKIGGVRIPTASAFLRFLDPENYGVVDQRVVSNYTNPHNRTNFNQSSDGYITDTIHNEHEYNHI
jgi:hypothetical protein